MSIITNRIKTGSASRVSENNYSNGTRISLVKSPDIDTVFLSKKRHINGFILPGFREDLDPSDAAFATSVSPYRSRNIQDPKTGCPAFTNWFACMEMYNFFGKGKNTFVSPKVVGMPDPIVDLRIHIYGLIRRQGRVDLKPLVERPANYMDIWPLPNADSMCVMNAVCTPSNEKAKEQNYKVRLLCLKTAATTKLFADLDTERPAYIATPLDPNWDEFMFGDVTSPTAALKFTQGLYQMDSNKTIEYPGIEFGTTLWDNGSRKLEYTRVNRAEMERWLPYRYNFTDTQNVIHIPSYDEIVGLLWEEGLIPHELITDVCRDKCENWDAIVNRASASTDVAPAATASYQASSSPQPATSYSSPAPAVDDIPMGVPVPAPAPAPAPAVQEYWVTDQGSTVRWDEHMLRARLASGWNGPVMKVGESAWKTAADYGMGVTSVAHTPAPAPAPAPAPVAAPTPMSMMPPASAAPAATAAASTNICRTKEQEDKFMQLLPRATGDMQPPLDGLEMNEFALLSSMEAYKG